MKAIRMLSLTLAMLLLVMSLASCALFKKDDAPTDDDTANGDATPEVVSLELVTKGTPNYVIVRDYKAGPLTIDAIAALVKAFKEVINCEIEVRECYSDREVEEDVPEAMARLRTIYPNLLHLSYDNTRTREDQIIDRAEEVRRRSPLELFGELYELQNNQPMSEIQNAYALELIRSIWEEDA